MMKVQITVDRAPVIKAMKDLDTKMRRKVMMKVGRAATKVLLPAMKKNVPTRTGWLKKAMAQKIKVYQSGQSLWAAAGPKAGFKILIRRTQKGRGKKDFVTDAVLQYKGKELAKVKVPKGGLGLNLAGQILIWPSKYAHLAGPRRRAVFVQKTVSGTKAAVNKGIAETLRQELGTT